MAEKLDMQSRDMVQENVGKIRELFPNAVTEVKKDGKVTLAVDFDVLKQELSDSLIDEKQERYQMTWPDKSKAKVLANTQISATLRPVREKSVDFDNTQNVYIEGDNLDVLKLLRETYLGKIKMIYIDPPYNTGNDFVYEDDFAIESGEYMTNSGQYDEQGNRLFQNKDSNGRFHTDWLNMIYPRLKVAKDLLSDDGVIFISIDDNEQANLKKICDEVFGESNFVVEFVWKCRNSLQHDEPLVTKQTERILFYVKDVNKWGNDEGKNRLNRIRKPFDATEYKNPDNDPRGPWLSSGKTRNDGRPSYTVISPTGVKFTRPWIPSPAEFAKWEAEGLIWWGKDGNSIPRKKAFLKDFKGNAISDILFDEYTDEISGDNLKRTKRWEIGTTESGTKSEKDLFNGVAVFDYPKPNTLIQYFCKIATSTNDIILDFFSGSATSAHAVMQLNAEDGGNRKFIMVQLPEPCEEKSEAYKAGYKTICDIGEERIRRAGKKIKEEAGLTAQNLDTGFRVFRLDSSNMQNVYYNPHKMAQSLLDSTIDNIKPDRTAEDLLFQVMLDLGVELSAKIEGKTVCGKTVYAVNDNDIIACFDEKINNEVIVAIAEQKPLYAVFRDSSFATDSVGINNEQLFKTYSPSTIIKVI